jgi:hypothetical protein
VIETISFGRSKVVQAAKENKNLFEKYISFGVYDALMKQSELGYYAEGDEAGVISLLYKINVLVIALGSNKIITTRSCMPFHFN